jgi:hypothetical protein
VKYSRGRIILRDRAALERAACECYQIIHEDFERLHADIATMLQPALTHA